VSPLPRAQAAIFDFDGTLADSVDHVIALYNASARFYRVRPVSHDDIRHMRGLKPLDAMRYMDMPMWKLPFIVRSVRKGMRARIAELSPFAGLEPALRGLRDAGVRCYVLSTNSRENIEAFLAQHQLQFFHELAGGSSVFGKAPHVKKLVKREGLDPARTYYVGDEVRDVEAARAAGVRSLSVSWGYSERAALQAEGPDLIVDSPAELLAALIAG